MSLNSFVHSFICSFTTCLFWCRSRSMTALIELPKFLFQHWPCCLYCRYTKPRIWSIQNQQYWQYRQYQIGKVPPISEPRSRKARPGERERWKFTVAGLAQLGGGQRFECMELEGGKIWMHSFRGGTRFECKASGTAQYPLNMIQKFSLHCRRDIIIFTFFFLQFFFPPSAGDIASLTCLSTSPITHGYWRTLYIYQHCY